MSDAAVGERARESCDVLIVGGGPAGSTCARQLRAAGLDVLVMDRQQFPRDKVCAGWITPAVVETLGLDIEDYRRLHVLQPITGFLTGVEGGRPLFTAYREPISYGIRRREFDHYLLERAGARLTLGESFDSMRRAGRHWIINDRIKTPLVIGAGGHFCPVARQLGARPGRGERAVTAQEIEFEMDAEQLANCPVKPDTPELYFCADMKGYGWIFRKGAYLNIGLGREGAHQLSRQVAAFRDRLIAEGRISARTPMDFHGHAYLLYTSGRRRLIDDGVMLIGDAAGLAYPQSGEGIRPAVESGLMAAAAVVAAKGHYDSATLAPYGVALTQRFGQRDESLRTAEEGVVLAGRWRRTLGAWLLRSRWFSQHVVLDRWFLHTQQKALTVEAI
ncbi:MAG: NAD(P)/FAD-dependent oxidoreductase [Chromatiales bacterium]|nr:NAD(P)/FAD-dependent oxidoreductase [Chromatiales bacterium]